LSPEGRARIIAATKRRWAALRKAKAAEAAPKAAAHAVKPAAARKRPAQTTKPAIVAKKAARRPSSGKSGAAKRSKAVKVQEPQVAGPAPGTVAATS
jgi:hypothetical protein